MLSYLQERNFSMGEYLFRKTKVPPQMAFQAQSPDQMQVWRKVLLAKLRDLLAPFPEKCDPNPVVLEKMQMQGYVREKIVFDSEEGMSIPAYLLIPNSLRHDEKRAAVICQHGHGHGKDDILGLTHGERRRVNTIRDHHTGYALGLVELGYVVLIPDARGFGERRLGYEFLGGDACKGCNIVFLKAMLMGLNPMTLNLWDLMRCLDYLQTRPEVDPARLGCVGSSLGGTLTLFLTALDERVKAAIVSCYFNLFGAFVLELGNVCGSQVVPGLLKYADLPDVASLVAPRPLFFVNGREDLTFPIEAAREGFKRVREAYRVAGAAESVEMYEAPGGHQFDNARAWPWLMEHLPAR